MVSREKQLKRLRKDAQRLWSDQQELLNRANGIARTAWPYATTYAKDRMGPTAATLYEERLRPVVGRGATVGAAAGKAAVSTAKDVVVGNVVPALSSAAAAALTLADEATNRLGFTGDTVKTAAAALGAVTKQGQKADRRAALKTAIGAAVAKGAGKAAKGAGKAAKQKAGRSGGLGVGGTIGILLGLTALAGIAYAIWQTLRADDDLWVADDEPDTSTPTTPTPPAA